MKVRYVPAVTVNPGGTGSPAPMSSLERSRLPADGPDIVSVDILEPEYCHSYIRRIREPTYESSGMHNYE